MKSIRLYILLALVGTIILSPDPAVAAKMFFVIGGGGSDKLWVTSSNTESVIEFNYECYGHDFHNSQVIYIDTYSVPMYGDAIIVDGLFGTKTCKVSDSKQVSISDFYVEDIVDSSDKIIVSDTLNQRYLVEYGIGCLSMWRYDNKFIHIDVSGVFLDGIGDTIYLFDSSDECRVWNVDNLDSLSATPILPNPQPPPTPAQTNASMDQACKLQNGQYVTYESSTNLCKCNTGYAINESNKQCIPSAQWCTNKYGTNMSYNSTTNLCQCNSGYIFDGTKCNYQAPQPVPVPLPPPIPASLKCSENYFSENGKCTCSGGFIIQNGQCLSPSQVCMKTYGQFSYGLEDGNGGAKCFCSAGYDWNTTKSSCERIASTIQNAAPPIPTTLPSAKTPTTNFYPKTVQAITKPIQKLANTELDKLSSGSTTKESQSQTQVETKGNEKKRGFWPSIRSFFGSIFSFFR